MCVFNKPSLTPPNLPEAPPPPTTTGGIRAQTAGDRSAVDAQRRSRASTLLTSATGLTSQATTTKKTLLGT